LDHGLPLSLVTPLVWAATISPGYFVLRTRFNRSTAMLLALPTSLVLLHTSVLLLQVLTGSVRGPAVGAILATMIIAALVTSPKRNRNPWEALREDVQAAGALVRRSLRPGDLRTLAVGSLVLASIVVVSVDFCIDPLRRMDNSFRWGNLAERIYALRTLSFYPPRSAADFGSYFLPDGIAPELSIGIWWCFTLGGSSAAANALGLIQLQALWLLLLIAAVARDVGGPSSYRRGLVLGCCATIPFSAISQGSESGLIAIGTLGALHALLQLGPRPEARRDAPPWSYAAVACASAAALAREYGPATLALTLGVLVVRRRPIRELVGATGLAMALAGTWYLRTWVRSGNPFYIHEVGGLFPGIPVFTHYLHYAYRQSTVLAMPASQLLRLAFWLFYGAPLAWILGGPMTLRRPRHLTVVFAGAWLVVYVIATSYSAGGYGFALRVASPTLAILSALAACHPLLSTPWTTSRRRALTVAAIGVLFAKTTTDLLCGAGARVWRLPLREAIRPAESFPWPIDDRVRAEVQRRGGRILSTNGHLTPVMRAYAIDLVPIWSPELRFLLDPEVSASEIRSRLRAINIRVYNPVPWEEYVSEDRARTLIEAFASWKPLPGTEPILFVED